MYKSVLHRIRYSIGPLVIALALSGCGSVGMSSRPTPTPIALSNPATGARSTARTYTVTRGEIVNYAAYSGKAVLSVKEDLYFQQSGRIAQVLVADGDYVEAGSLIAELDTELAELDLQSARLALEIAKQQLAEAEEGLKYDRQNAELVLEIAKLRLEAASAEGAVILQRQVDQAEIALERLPQQINPIFLFSVERAQLAIDKIEASLSDARIVAPLSGEVRFITLSNDERLPSATAFTPVAQLVDANSLQIELNLTRVQLEPLREGIAVDIFLTGQTSAPLRGVIRTLPRPFGSGAGPLALVEIQEQAENLRLFEGSTVDVRLELARKSDTLLLPVAALYGFSGQYFVRAEDGSGQRAIDVEVGIQNEEFAELLAGVDAGTVVVGRE